MMTKLTPIEWRALIGGCGVAVAWVFVVVWLYEPAELLQGERIVQRTRQGLPAELQWFFLVSAVATVGSWLSVLWLLRILTSRGSR